MLQQISSRPVPRQGRVATPNNTLSVEVIWMRRLFWAYIFLWIFEGALRKWFLPSLATPLLIIRDPIAIAIYVFAWRRRLFPNNFFLTILLPISIFSLVAGCYAPDGAPAVAVYGFRANFLHLPLIFLIPTILTEVDVRKICGYFLWLSVPMALLMALQFRAAPESFINAGADLNFKQLALTGDKIRAAGTFSYTQGPASFFTLVAAILLGSQFKRGQFPVWLESAAFAALLLASVVSGSRSLLASVAIVILTGFTVGGILRPWMVFRWIGIFLTLGVLMATLAQMPVVQEALGTFNTRFEQAGQAEGGASGFVERFFHEFSNAGVAAFEAPLFGSGLGLGTNAGAALLSGKVTFLLAEGEWPRVVLESGPLLGGLFLFWRMSLVLWLGVQAATKAGHGQVLPSLIFAAAFLPLFNGQFGSSTVVGYTVISSALCLASMRVRKQVRVVKREPEQRIGRHREDAIPIQA